MMTKCYSVSRSWIDESNDSVSRSWSFHHGIGTKITSTAKDGYKMAGVVSVWFVPKKERGRVCEYMHARAIGNFLLTQDQQYKRVGQTIPTPHANHTLGVVINVVFT